MQKRIFLGFLFVTLAFTSWSQVQWENNAFLGWQNLHNGDTLDGNDYIKKAFESLASEDPKITGNNYDFLYFILNYKINDITTHTRVETPSLLKLNINLLNYLKNNKIKDSYFLKNTYANTYFLFDEKNNYDSALFYCLQEISFIQSFESWTLNDSMDFAASNFFAAKACEKKSNYVEAIKFYLTTLPVAKKISGDDHPYVAMIENNIGTNYVKNGLFEKAFVFFESSLSIRENKLGENHPDVAQSLNNIGQLFSDLGQYEKALTYIQKAQEIYIKYWGYYHPDVALSFNNLGIINTNLGLYKRSISCYEEALKIWQKTLSEEDPMIALGFSNLAESYHKIGQFERALSFNELALNIRKKVFGNISIDVALSLNNLATIHSDLGHYSNALSLTQQALDIYKSILGMDNLSVAINLNNMAEIKAKMSQYKEALSLYEQSLSIRIKLLGKEHPDVAQSLNNIAELNQNIGQYKKAISFNEQALSIREKSLGNEHPDVALSLNNLAGLYLDLGQYEKTKTLYEQSIIIKKKALGSEHPDVAASLTGLANLYSLLNENEKALPLYEQSLQIDKNALGEEHPDVAVVINNLALLYSNMGQYEKALSLFEQSLQINKKTYGDENPEVAISLNNLAELYCEMGQFENALPLFEHSLKINKKSFGEEHLSVATSTNNLANVFSDIGQYEKAQPLYEKSLQISKKILGVEHPDVASSLNNLAELYRNMGKYEKAIPLYEQSLNIRKKTLGNDHPYVATSLSNLAVVYSNMGKYGKAINLQKSSLIITNKNISSSILFIGDAERTSYLNTKLSHFDIFDSFQLLKGDSISLSTISNFNNLQFLQNLSLNISRKMREQIQQSGDSILQTQFLEYTSLQLLYNRGLTMTVEDRLNRNINLDSVQEEITKSERGLVQRSVTFGHFLDKQNLQYEQVLKALKSNQAFVQFHSFPFFSRTGWTDSIMYVAYVVRPEMTEPVMIPLFEERSLDSLLSAPDVSSLVMNLYRKRDASLYHLLWKPLLASLINATEIFIAPSGLLHKISFAAISDSSGSFLSDTYTLHQVLGAQDFVYPENPSVFSSADSTLQIALFGGIRYDQPSNNTNVTASVKDTLLFSSLSLLPKDLDRGSSWNYLPGTEQEVQQIKSLFSKKNLAAETYTGYEATEQQLKKMEGNQSPRILHIATHGFFAPDPKVNFKKKNLELMANENTFRTSDNPLLRSGILMAGANDAWKGNATLSGDEDGVLTAQEVSCMRLNNTQLVVLSACETGLGDIHGREGVYGLQRAFRLAGAKFLLLSLWRIPDKETSEFMQLFYTNLLQINNIPQAYTLARNTMKNRYPEDPLKWAGLVLVE